jgi:hypothetical protein
MTSTTQGAGVTLDEGEVFNFRVVAKNKSGRELPVTDASVDNLNPSVGVAVVDPATGVGTFTASSDTVGGTFLIPKAGGVEGAEFPIAVQTDVTVATVELVPVPDAVVIVPA